MLSRIQPHYYLLSKLQKMIMTPNINLQFKRLNLFDHAIDLSTKYCICKKGDTKQEEWFKLVRFRLAQLKNPCSTWVVYNLTMLLTLAKNLIRVKTVTQNTKTNSKIV